MTAPSRGRCEVVLYTPTHEGSLATLTSQELARGVAIWTDRSRELWEGPAHAYVLVFENRCEDVGASLRSVTGRIASRTSASRHGAISRRPCAPWSTP